MSKTTNSSRRDFLRTSAVAGGGLILGFYLPAGRARAASEESASAAFAPNAFLRIGTDGSVTIIVNKSEMGQGVFTSLPMLIAEELDADWSKIRVEAAPVDPAYNHTVFGMQITGGSTSVSSSWTQFRNAGATAKAMLLAAAANQWQVKASECHADNGFVIHGSSKRRLSYGSLAGAAGQLKPPKDAPLKDPKDFKLIGKRIKRLDTHDKTNGKAVFGIDVKLPGLLTAVLLRPPVFGARVKTMDASKARASKGVRDVVQLDSGIAVVADGFWTAAQGRDALKVEWDEGPLERFDTKSQTEQYAALARTPGMVAKRAGDAENGLERSAKRLEAVYDVPYLAHATMEPMNCTAVVGADQCEVWTGSQMQTVDRLVAAQAAGLKPEQVKLHTMLLGGGFGRRAMPDCHVVREAVLVAKAVRAPVKVVWTREDDMRGGYYRPRYLHTFAAGLDTEGKPLAWHHRIVGQSIMAGTPFEGYLVRDGIDGSSVEGATDLPYSIPNLKVELHSPRIGIPVLWWRSVGSSHTAFVTEAFLDEVAAAAGKDPYQYRRELLSAQPRHRAVLDLAAQKAGWGTPLAAGRGRGIAVHHSFDSYVAQVAEVSVAKDGGVKVHRVVCAIDCGTVVNPDIVEAQMESAIVFGLSAALHGEITFKNGQVEQSNFHDYPVLTMSETPKMEVHIVSSNEPPTGVGEPGVPPVAPAVTNAIFAATGKRVRKLPIRMDQA